MNYEIGLVLSILLVTIVLFIWDKFEADVVSLLTVLALMVTGALHTSDALAGFGNPVVITIASVFLVTAGLANTGIAAWIGRRILRLGGTSEPRLQAVTMGAAALLSLVMNNIASASVLMPGISSAARQTGISSSRLMIPLAFGTTLGGMATLFTTINILVNDSLRTRGLGPFTLWDFFKIGIVLTICGVVLMVTIGRKLLPNYPMKTLSAVRRLPAELVRLYKLPESLFQARILAGSPLDGRTVAETRLGEVYQLHIVGIIRQGRMKLAPSRGEVLRSGDRLLLEGEEERLVQSQEGLGLLPVHEGAIPSPDLADRDVGVVEAVVSPHADLVGRSLREIQFREKFGLTVLAIHREGVPITAGLPDIPIRFGDALLIQGQRTRLRLLRAERNFIVLDEPELEPAVRPDKAPWALAALLAMLVLAGFGLTGTATAALFAAVAMVVSGALKMEEGYRAIEWKAVVLIGGMLSMSTALDKTGAAALIASTLLEIIGPLGPKAITAGVYLLSMLFAQAMSGTAAAALIAPIAVSSAAQLQVSPYPLLMAVVLGTSSAFLTPVSHPVNVLVMGPGGYKFTDYARIGSVITFVVFVATVALVPRFWPF